MTPDTMAQIHSEAFTHERAWSAAEFADLLAQKHTHLTARPFGFALIRVIADEAELLTLAVSPRHQRQGIAHALMAAWIAQATALGAQSGFLEVASDNTAARALYRAYDFAQIASRPAYYRRTDAPAADALILKRAFTTG